MNDSKQSKYSITVNERDGIKVNFTANDEKTLKMFEGLTEKLIAKLEPITVNQPGSNDYE